MHLIMILSSLGYLVFFLFGGLIRLSSASVPLGALHLRGFMIPKLTPFFWVPLLIVVLLIILGLSKSKGLAILTGTVSWVLILLVMGAVRIFGNLLSVVVKSIMMLTDLSAQVKNLGEGLKIGNGAGMIGMVVMGLLYTICAIVMKAPTKATGISTVSGDEDFGSTTEFAEF